MNFVLELEVGYEQMSSDDRLDLFRIGGFNESKLQGILNSINIVAKESKPSINYASDPGARKLLETDLAQAAWLNELRGYALTSPDSTEADNEAKSDAAEQIGQLSVRIAMGSLEYGVISEKVSYPIGKEGPSNKGQEHPIDFKSRPTHTQG